MYNRSFGLRRNPFNMTPDPSFLFLTAQHREALVGLSYAILQRKGFVVLTGEAGTGKTTLLARVLQFIPASQVQSSVILNPTLTPSEFLELALLDFGVTDVPTSKAQRLWTLRNLLLKAREKGRVSALIIDEAHKLSREVLEEIRLLGNFEEADEKFLQIVLIGQNELDDSLNREDLRQLKQRIAVRLSIAPLAPSEVSQYVRHRWLRAGGSLPPFSAEAMSLVAAASHGIPRLINGLCDNALTLAFGEGASTVDARHVQASAVDLHLSAKPQALEAEEPGALMIPEMESMQDVDSSNGSDSKPSLWTKWRGRVRLTPRAETGDLS
jgi:general secretion pathway protein A